MFVNQKTLLGNEYISHKSGKKLFVKELFWVIKMFYILYWSMSYTAMYIIVKRENYKWVIQY